MIMIDMSRLATEEMLAHMLKPVLASLPQGDNGEKGPEGASGKDGGRVSVSLSCCHVCSAHYHQCDIPLHTHTLSHTHTHSPSPLIMWA